MLPRCLSLVPRNIFNNIAFKGFSTQTDKWDIFAAVCVERLPIVTPALSNTQRKFKSLLEQIELEKSYKSDHEIKHEQDLIFMEQIKKNADFDADNVNKITAQDFEDSCSDEFAKFQPAPLETEADRNNNIKSLDRSLQSHLILLVEQQLGSQSMFVLPQGKHADGETLRQTAERVLKDMCGGNIAAQFYGNAPSGYYKYKYPKNNNGATGAKVFFYYSRLLSGQVKDAAQYKWLNRKELRAELPSSYHSSISDFLVSEKS